MPVLKYFVPVALGLVVSARAITVEIEQPPSVHVMAGDNRYVIEPRLSDDQKGWVFDQTIETDEFMIQLDGFLDPDPSIAYGIAVTDYGAPSVFGFLFFTPIVPTGPGTVVNGSLVGGFTDMTGDGVSITPTGALVQTSDLHFPATAMGVDVGPAFAAPAGPAGALYPYGAFSSGVIPGPVGLWTGLSVSAGFGLSGGGDIAVLTGFASVETAAVPEGSAGWVGGAVLAGICALGRRFRPVQV